jgi:predicted ester cyclase
MDKKEIVSSFIERVWNLGQLEELEHYLSADFVDYSLPKGFGNDLQATRRWILATGKSFQHRTSIEDIIAEDNKVFVRITMTLKHTGDWRSYPATGKEIVTTGYRSFEFSGNKIIVQWASIDGNLIEEAIAGDNHACKA